MNLSIHEPEEARRRWVAYHLGLDFARAWLEHASPGGGWRATMEEAHAAHEAPKAEAPAVEDWLAMNERLAAEADAEAEHEEIDRLMMDTPSPVEACEEAGEIILANDAFSEAEIETVERFSPSPRPSSVLNKLSRSLAASVHPWPMLPVKPAFSPMRLAH
jgi:hypothetical protein